MNLKNQSKSPSRCRSGQTSNQSSISKIKTSSKNSVAGGVNLSQVMGM